PKSDGTFPQESIDRLKAIGDWMRLNNESIYGTKASPLEHIAWGRITQKQMGENARLYLHVFNWPKNGKLVINGLENEVMNASLLAGGKKIQFSKKDNVITLQLPVNAPDPVNTVIVLDIKGSPVVYKSPVINANADIFVNNLAVEITLPPAQGNVVVHYTINGTVPSAASPVYKGKLVITKNTVIKARSFNGTKAVSGVVERKFSKVIPALSLKLLRSEPGLAAAFYEGEWDKIPDFKKQSIKESKMLATVSPGEWKGKEKYGVVLEGYIMIPESEVYNFYLSSDDGSKMYLNNKLLIDNDGLHGMVEKKGIVALSAGYHKIRIEFFEKNGGDDLQLFIESPKIKKQEAGKEMLFH
ncbi:MAG: hypothetical protein EPN92_08600, partial [Chitinophagaceae bacterium]